MVSTKRLAAIKTRYGSPELEAFRRAWPQPPGMSQMGRASWRRDTYLACVAEGHTQSDILAMLDVSITAYEGWRKRYPRWAAQVDEARGAHRSRRKVGDRQDETYGGNTAAGFVAFAQDFFPDRNPHMPQQLAIVNTLMDLKPRDICMFLQPPESGKELAADTLIPTVGRLEDEMGLEHNAFTKIGDLTVGSMVYAADGTPTRVTGVYHQEPHVCYQLTFSDGTTVVAGPDHQWVVRSRRIGRSVPGARTRADKQARADQIEPWFPARGGYPARILTTSQMIEAGVTTGGRPNHAIPVPLPLDGPAEQLPIAPYTYGFWLGNGDKRGGRVTINSHDEADVVANIEADGYTVTPGTPGRGCVTRTVTSLSTRLRLAELRGRRHIPDAYLQGAATDRFALLAGLLDSDGHCDKRGRVEYTTTDPDLRDGFRTLLRSLGLKHSYLADRARLNGKDYGPRYRFTFVPHHPVFRASRKAARQIVVDNDRNRWRRIRSIEQVPTVPTVCIAVEHPSATYVFGEQMLVTHNTSTLEDYICFKLAQDPGHRFRVISQSQTHSKRMVDFVKRRMTDLNWLAYQIRWGPFYEKGQERKSRPWHAEEITIANAPGDERDRSLVASSWTSATYGSRIDTLIVDDVCALENVNQSGELLRRIQVTFLNRGIEMRTLIVGTRIRHEDFYQKLMDSQILTRAPIIWPAADPEGNPIVPQFWERGVKHDGNACCRGFRAETCPKNGAPLTAREFMELIRHQSGEDTWWGSYMQNPIANPLSTFAGWLPPDSDLCCDFDRAAGELIA